jgi:hypothetical protein
MIGQGAALFPEPKKFLDGKFLDRKFMDKKSLDKKSLDKKFPDKKFPAARKFGAAYQPLLYLFAH